MGIKKISIRDVGSMQPHSILWDLIVHGFNASGVSSLGEKITFSVTYRTKRAVSKNGINWWALPILTPHLASARRPL